MAMVRSVICEKVIKLALATFAWSPQMLPMVIFETKDRRQAAGLGCVAANAVPKDRASFFSSLGFRAKNSACHPQTRPATNPMP